MRRPDLSWQPPVEPGKVSSRGLSPFWVRHRRAGGAYRAVMATIPALTLPAVLVEDLMDDTIASGDVDTDAEVAVLLDAVNTQLNALAVAVNQLRAAVAVLDRRTRHPLLERRNRSLADSAQSV